MQFPAQAKVQGSRGRHAPIVLIKRGQRIGVLTPGSAVDAALNFIGQAEGEIGFGDTAIGAACARRQSLSRVITVEQDGAGAAITRRKASETPL